MTYSIVVRDPETGELGLATQSQAFAVGASVPWAEPGVGVIATQSMAEPAYGRLGLELIQSGLTATEALAALETIDPHPERRQVAMIDTRDEVAAYTGDACVASAGHTVGDHCCALGNMVASPDVWTAMVDAYQGATGTLAERLVGALEAAEAAGGDIRGRRSAAVLVVRAQRTGRPWRDQIVDLRVDASDDPVAELGRLVDAGRRYQATVRAFEAALDGAHDEALDGLAALPAVSAERDPDQVLWRAVIHASAGRRADARAEFDELAHHAPAFVDTAQRFVSAGLLDGDVLDGVLPAD